MKQNTEFYECLIIGAGLSGIAAAIRLSHFEKKVILIEKNSTFGGLNTFYFKNGIEIDSGLHAMTNFCKKNDDKSLPLNKLLRQLRIGYDELELAEHIQSEIRFPFASLTFENNFSQTKEKIKNLFPESAGDFERLVQFISGYDAFSLENKNTSSTARNLIRKFINNKKLEDLILLPIMYYGNPAEEDMETSQFVIMFKSIFMEGLCRPEQGIKKLLKILTQKLNENACEIRKNTSVKKISFLSGGGFEVALSDNTEIMTKKIISSIGANETLKLIENNKENKNPNGEMAFAEAVFCLKNKDFFNNINFRNACTFFCDDNDFKYQKPQNPFSTKSGVLCCPSNFRYKKDDKKYSFIRLTALANYEKWMNLPPENYKKLKEEFKEEALAKIAKLIGAEITQEDIILSDVFTPKTIQRWTGHINGAIYGCPNKFKDGKTEYENLFLCGTDQGFLGITGSILSGISIANKYALM